MAKRQLTVLPMIWRLLMWLLSASLLAVLTACGTDPGVGTGLPTSTPESTGTISVATATPVPGRAAIPLTSIRMLNATSGWALSETDILKTQDGGLHWKSLRQIQVGGLDAQPQGAFMDSNHAWVAYHDAQGPNGTFTILRTTDGGASWQNSNISSALDGISTPHFVNTQWGWIEAYHFQGMHHTSGELFRTNDGGVSWSLIANTDAQPQTGLTNGGNGLSFKDTQNGWITGEIPSSRAFLETTGNGGDAWHAQSLPIPDGLTSESVGDTITTPPVFFGNDGLLPVSLFSNETDFDMYITHDGGRTWAAQPLARLDMNQNGDASIDNIYVLTMNQSWMNAKTGFYGSTDGGKTWHHLSDLPQPIGKMSFVDATHGWAIGTRSNKNPLLLATSDGGKTWQQMNYTLQ
ncbi:WD40/YVTN/BNR-like repeat-containing protein [Tengunoibacter tsumagoiensis]|nr:hypothetical protein [Tengunoibacter tsumagoiensis]